MLKSTLKGYQVKGVGEHAESTFTNKSGHITVKYKLAGCQFFLMNKWPVIIMGGVCKDAVFAYAYTRNALIVSADTYQLTDSTDNAIGIQTAKGRKIQLNLIKQQISHKFQLHLPPSVKEGGQSL